LDADQLFGSIEQHLFSQVAFHGGKTREIDFDWPSLRPMIYGMVSCALPPHCNPAPSSSVVLLQDNTEEQARQNRRSLARKLPDPTAAVQPGNSLCPIGDKIYKVLGPHAPNLTANEVKSARTGYGCGFSESLAREELHHHDVVHSLP